MAFGLLSGIGSVLGGLGGLFGKKKSPDARANMVLQAQGARQAAEKYGFNPLTMLQYGQPGGAMGGGGGTPPLASVQMIVDGLKGIDDVTSGDAERRRAADQLELDLAQLKLDQTRSGVVAVTPIYAREGVGQGPSPLGGRSVEVYPSHGGSLGGSYGRETAGRSDDSGRLSFGPRLSSGGGIPVPDPLLDRGTGVFVGGEYWEPTPGLSPASVAEEEYGDFGGSIFGLGKAVTDILYNNLAVPIGASEDDQSRIDRESLKGKRPKGKPVPEYWTHPETGFSAKRRRFGM